MELKGGASTSDQRLDRVYELDWRSLDYPVSATLTADQIRYPRSYTWALSQYFDQGRQGACVGFGFAHELAAAPIAVAGVTDGWGREIYWLAQREDPWPGGSYEGADPFYEGTSVLTGAKVVQDLGHYSSYLWGLTMQEAVNGVCYSGPAVLGLNWYTGMFNPDASGFIRPTGTLAGGHCILAVGVKIVWKSWVNRLFSRKWENVDLDKSYLILHNSWGQDWGTNGRAKLSLTDFDRLLNEQGDAVFPKRIVRV